MEWFYVVDGTQAGPVGDSQLDELVRAGAIDGGTMVWREGLAEWTPLAAVRPVPGPEPILSPPRLSEAPPSSTSACSECHRPFPESEMVCLHGCWVCSECKPRFVQRLKEGAVPDRQLWQPGQQARISTILRDTNYVYRNYLGTIAAVVLAVWLPLNLLSSYMDYFVFGPEDFRKSLRFSMFLEGVFGLIGTGAVIAVANAWRSGRDPSFSGAMQTGFSAWGRMWWTNVLVTIAMLFGFLFLLVPGVYLLVRLILTSPIVVCEGLSGTNAMRRSFELTRGRFWQVSLLILISALMVVFGYAVVTVPTAVWPAMDHWLFVAGSTLVGDLAMAYTVCLLNAYHHYSINAVTEKPLPSPSPS